MPKYPVLATRPTELSIGKANPEKAKIQLGWEAKYKMSDVVQMMVQARLDQGKL
ncbi:hypothetical protein H6F32_18675 [Anabaena sp. FACHB-1237]|uniref:hypothetical protein n=1 Tax=Anabaena sp. FACHB-1237 TaxID=2692769 RepID=UPI0016809A03|nr:hypothetical protein [Anabaena sp. FACHB-1237]MBD2139535.1 hypothetical protein [Anabaena sp. FACHB-1237]